MLFIDNFSLLELDSKHPLLTPRANPRCTQIRMHAPKLLPLPRNKHRVGPLGISRRGKREELRRSAATGETRRVGAHGDAVMGVARGVVAASAGRRGRRGRPQGFLECADGTLWSGGGVDGGKLRAAARGERVVRLDESRGPPTPAHHPPGQTPRHGVHLSDGAGAGAAGMRQARPQTRWAWCGRLLSRERQHSHPPPGRKRVDRRRRLALAPAPRRRDTKRRLKIRGRALAPANDGRHEAPDRRGALSRRVRR